MSACIDNGEELKITLYENDVPSFVEPELERLYGSLFSSLANFRASGGLPQANTFVVSYNGRVKAVFIFRLNKNEIQVLNEGMQLSQEDVDMFTKYVFDTYPAANKISFHAVTSEFAQLGFPFHHTWCDEDIIVKLPSTVEEYTASLGSSTRKTIKYRMNRLKRSFPSFKFECFEKAAVKEEHVREIIQFNKARMDEKNKTWRIDDKEMERILSLVKELGFVGVATIDGRVVAGTITFRIGENHFSRVNAHDPAYNEHRLGLLCCYLMICECIKRGAKQFHLQYGRYDYKFALQGALHSLEHVSIYRSHAHLLLDSASVTSMSLKNQAKKTAIALNYKADCKDGKQSEAARLCIQTLRSLKQATRSIVDLAKSIRLPLYHRKG